MVGCCLPRRALERRRAKLAAACRRPEPLAALLPSNKTLGGQKREEAWAHASYCTHKGGRACAAAAAATPGRRATAAAARALKRCSTPTPCARPAAPAPRRARSRPPAAAPPPPPPRPAWAGAARPR